VCSLVSGGKKHRVIPLQQVTPGIQCESKKHPLQPVFYTPIIRSTLDYKFLFSYLKL